MYSKYVCLCSVHIHITTRPESMTHCSCFFLVHFIYFAIKFQCDLPITCTNCILKLIYCHNGMRDETLIQPIHCCRSQRVGAAIAIILFFRLRLPFLRLQCRPLRQRMVQILHFSAKRIVRILKTITCLVNTVEWQPLQIDPFCRKCMCRSWGNLNSRETKQKIFIQIDFGFNPFKNVLSLSLFVSLCSSTIFSVSKLKNGMKRRGRCLRNIFFYSNRVEWSVLSFFSLLFSSLRWNPVRFVYSTIKA